MPKQRPNIIICMCDQLRASETGCYGNTVARTPHIDRLAREGVRFQHAVTNYPVCMAARSVTLSGQYNRTCTGGVGNVAYQSRPGDFNMPEYPEHGRPHLKSPTLPELLKPLGYRSAAIGKWHIHSWPHDIGFDYYLIPRVHHCHTGQSFTENGGPEFVPDGFSVDFEAERVEAFLKARARMRQPFFLYYNISPPHCPLADAPEKYLKMYDPADVPIRPNVDLSATLPKQDYWFKVYRWDFRYYHLHLPYTETLPDGYTLRHLIAEYYGLTTWMDDAVGRMLDALDGTGLAENTIVVFTADHGDNLGSHGRVQKGSPNEESIGVPLVLRWPASVRQEWVCSEGVASLVDLAPTLLEMAGASSPPHMQGRSLAPVLRGDAAALEENWAFVEMGGAAAIHTPTHLYCLPFAKDKRELDAFPNCFYNVANDPCELHNLAGTKHESDVGRRLDSLLRRWHQATPWMAE
jgi:arylsulfatase A-like enzyme